jgi:methylthioribose-1-phosphate isomerase
MKIDGKQMRTIWVESDGAGAGIIDQTSLPHRFATVRLSTLEDAARAIKTMQVRGAPLIGAAAAYGVWLALRADASDEALERSVEILKSCVWHEPSAETAWPRSRHWATASTKRPRRWAWR